MSKEAIPNLAKAFLSTYDAAGKDQLWKQQQETFRSFWANRVLDAASAPLSDDECDAIIRILDTSAKGHTKSTESVARVMVTQRAWRAMFNQFHANQKLAALINRIFETENLDQKALLIDDLYALNKGQRNSLTGPSANTINALLATYDPLKNLSIVSLNDRRRLIEFLEIPVPFDWDGSTIGTRIVQTNTILYDGLHAAGVPGSARTVSRFCYSEPVRSLWKLEDAAKRTDETSDDEKLDEAGDEFLAIMRRYRDERTVFCSATRGARYSVEEVDEKGCTVTRLDANEVVRCTANLVKEKLRLIRDKGGAHPFDDSFVSTSAIRNSLLQSNRLALSADRSTIVDVSNPERGVQVFSEILKTLRVDESSGQPKLYKPAMVACVLEGIANDELNENRIRFDWLVPRFVEKMKMFGKDVRDREAAMPFFHLTGDLFWMLSYNDLSHLVSDGREGPEAIRNKVSHASIKDTFWVLLQRPEYRNLLEKSLADAWWSSKKPPRFWVEKTIIKDRPDRQSGENALGQALWSPQKAEDGKDIYRAMVEIRPGDIAFHFVDNQRIEGFSTVTTSADPSFIGLDGTDWAGRPAYRIALANHQPLAPPIDRAEFLGDGEYRPMIQQLLNKEKGLFFNREFNLNQGAYITEAPLTLIQIWNDIHRRKTGSPIIPDVGALDKALVFTRWIFQGNPDRFDLNRYLRERNEIVWTVNQHEDLVHAGHRVLMWRSGANGGVVAECTVASEPSAEIAEDAPELYSSTARPFKEATTRCKLRVVHSFTGSPIPRDLIQKTVPELTIFKFAQNTNFPISEADYDTILRLRQGASIAPPPRIVSPKYSLADCAKETGFEIETLKRWKRALGRKGQAIFYGPPGTGKTFVAERLAKHIVAGTDGLQELVQFHPAYSYEDFMQGIRPEMADDRTLAYSMAHGRFMEFCETASRRRGPSVMIIDEINRANLSRVFGELMYLLEYRNREIPLAGGGVFQIPQAVQLIGTMNTADRSIALVDHALRRRFTFIALHPEYEILSRYQKARGFDATKLIQQLKLLNSVIADRHYEVGITFFLRDELASEIADIWQMEIEPYLEEFFFDQPQKFEQFRWDTVQHQILA